MSAEELREMGLEATADAYEGIAEGRKHGAPTCHNWVQWSLDELLASLAAETKRADEAERERDRWEWMLRRSVANACGEYASVEGTHHCQDCMKTIRELSDEYAEQDTIPAAREEAT